MNFQLVVGWYSSRTRPSYFALKKTDRSDFRVGRGALTRNDDGAHAEVMQLVLDLGFAVAAVSSDGARAAPGAADDPPNRGRQLG
jgi:hypothetical protein